MERLITSQIIIAYSQCPYKAYLLMFEDTNGEPNEYVQIIEQRKQINQIRYIDTLQEKSAYIQSYSNNILKNNADVLTDVILHSNGFIATGGMLQKFKEDSSLDNVLYKPIVFTGTHSIPRETKIELLFYGYVLGIIQHYTPESGEIIDVTGQSHKIRIGNPYKKLRRILEPLHEWIQGSSTTPPGLILTKKCLYCQFETSCRKKAEVEDNLSLLDKISTPKLIKKYEKKGIFTIKQLSYVFKPRRRPKRLKKAPLPYKPELQALAIRTGKTYLQKVPEIPKYEGEELFLDIEGIPDEQFYYLIGILIHKEDTDTYHPFWANTRHDEEQMWKQMLHFLHQYATAPIYHYGNYDSKAFNKLAKRYGIEIEAIKKRLINVNAYIYGNVYFPVKSNSLKDIGPFLGVHWKSQDASGLKSLIWRYSWEDTHDPTLKIRLLDYNEDDCQALRTLKEKLSTIQHAADTLSEIDFVNQPKQIASPLGLDIHHQFEAILECAHARYDKKKITFQQLKEKADKKPIEKKPPSTKKGYHGQRKIRPKVAKIVDVPKEEFCPKHEQIQLCPTQKVSKRIIIDLVLTKNGIKKTVIEYRGIQGYCKQCVRSYAPPEIRKFGRTQLYGFGFKVWYVYQRVALRVPYEKIAELIEEQFGEKMSWGYGPALIREISNYYAETAQIIIQELLKNPVIHADETPINIRGKTQYVWVFTDGENVVFKLRETREASIVHEFLANYSGVLVSDFYAGYDTVPCHQQKCWVHLIRDMNNDLWETPFDVEFEQFIFEVKALITPIIAAVQKYGLKKRHLNKFKKQVDIFYEKVIVDQYYKSEKTNKYQKRFLRYRESLFSFIEYDDVPWHNNAAERAIRHVVKQSQISGNFHESITHDYLLLLGIRQACRFQGKSFLRFLFSGEKDIGNFKR